MASMDGVLAAVGVILGLGLATTAALPALRLRIVSPPGDLVVDTVSTMVALVACVLALVRYRDHSGPVALFQAAGFLPLVIAGGATILIVVTGLKTSAGTDPSGLGQAAVYLSTTAQIMAAGLLLIGARASQRGTSVGHPGAIVAGAAAVMAILLALVLVGGGGLPALTSAGVSSADTAAEPSTTSFGMALDALAAVLFFGGAAMSRMAYRRDGWRKNAYMSVALLVAGFAQVAGAIDLGWHAGLVSTSDLLRLAFVVIALGSIVAEMAGLIHRVHRARSEDARLWQAQDTQRALEERARLARELHDGLSQELWVAKLKVGRLAALPDLGLEARALTVELDQAIGAGLTEAQQAVAALRLSADSSGTLCDLLSRTVHEFSDRFGLHVEFQCGQDLPPVSPRAQAETLRVAQEALTNVWRHADATVVRVAAHADDSRLVLTIDDNGCGFDLAEASLSSYGITAMRERAALIGAELQIDSRPQDGTRVSLRLPIATAAAGLGAGRP